MGQFCAPRRVSSPTRTVPVCTNSSAVRLAPDSGFDSDDRPAKRRRLMTTTTSTDTGRDPLVPLTLSTETYDLLMRSVSFLDPNPVVHYRPAQRNKSSSVLSQLPPPPISRSSSSSSSSSSSTAGVPGSLSSSCLRPRSLLLQLLRTTPLGKAHRVARREYLHELLRELPIELVLHIFSFVTETGLRVSGRSRGGHDDIDSRSGEVDEKIPFRAFVVEGAGHILSEYHRRPLRSESEYLRILFGRFRDGVIRLVWPSVCVVGVSVLGVFRKLVPWTRSLKKLSLASCNLMEIVDVFIAETFDEDSEDDSPVRSEEVVKALQTIFPPRIRHLLLLDVIVDNHLLECVVLALRSTLEVFEMRGVSADLELEVCSILGSTVRKLVIVNCAFVSSDCFCQGLLFNEKCTLVDLFLHGTSVLDMEMFHRFANRTVEDWKIVPAAFQIRPVKPLEVVRRQPGQANSTLRVLTLESLPDDGNESFIRDVIEVCEGLEKFYSSDCRLTCLSFAALLRKPSVERIAFRELRIAKRDIPRLLPTQLADSKLEFLTICNAIPRLPLNSFMTLSRLPSLEKLVLDGSNLTDENILNLCRSSLATRLESLSCVNCPRLTSTAAELISRHLRRLVNLNYSMNNISAQVLVGGFYKLPMVEMLGLNGISTVTDAEIRQLPWRITMLLVQQTEVTETGIRWIKECTQVNVMVHGQRKAIRWEREML